MRQRLFHHPVMMFQPILQSNTELTMGDIQTLITSGTQSAQISLPPNIHLVTLDTLPDDAILLRLEHYFETGEDALWSMPVKIDLTVGVNSKKLIVLVRFAVRHNQDGLRTDAWRRSAGRWRKYSDT